jgi:hypothetical protein
LPASLHRKLRHLAIKRRGKADLLKKAKWAPHGSKQVSRLIEDVCDLVGDLEGLPQDADVWQPAN